MVVAALEAGPKSGKVEIVGTPTCGLSTGTLPLSSTRISLVKTTVELEGVMSKISDVYSVTSPVA